MSHPCSLMEPSAVELLLLSNLRDIARYCRIIPFPLRMTASVLNFSGGNSSIPEIGLHASFIVLRNGYNVFRGMVDPAHGREFFYFPVELGCPRNVPACKRGLFLRSRAAHGMIAVAEWTVLRRILWGRTSTAVVTDTLLCVNFSIHDSSISAVASKSFFLVSRTNECPRTSNLARTGAPRR